MKHVKRAFLVQGLNLERFVNLACEAGLRIDGMHRKGRTLRGRCDEADFATLRTVADKGGWAFSAYGRYGYGKLLDMSKRRWVMATALAITMVIACVLYQLVWRVELIDAEQYQGDAEAYLEQNEIRPFVWKNSIDLRALRDTLEWRYPQVAWIECGWRGTTLRIVFSQGVPQGETIHHDGGGDVIAARDGIVESIVTVAGTPVVKAGEIVRKGQVLIKGEERIGNEQLMSVAAQGTVLARVWDGAAVRVPLVEARTTYTGESNEVWYAVSPWFSLWKTPDSTYQQEDITRSITPVGGLFFPIWLMHETRMEAEVKYERGNIAKIQAEAGDAAMRKLMLKIGLADDLVDKWVDCCMIEDEVVEAIAIAERVIDIALQQRYTNDLTGKAAPDQ